MSDKTLVEKLRATLHNGVLGDGTLVPVTFVNPNGPEAADTLLAIQGERDALREALKPVFLAGHSEGWTGNQQRRDVQHVDAEKGWKLYVENGALDKLLVRAALTPTDAP